MTVRNLLDLPLLLLDRLRLWLRCQLARCQALLQALLTVVVLHCPSSF